MQNQELLAKLAQARQAQALAWRRFTLAQERLAQLETRQQALRARLPTPEYAEDSPKRTFLPENGELELQASFTPLPQTDQEITERIVTRPTETEAPQ
ncbi:MAG: hypothetical protein ACRDHZ_17035 [Ktedonobacteraceae bacterium]